MFLKSFLFLLLMVPAGAGFGQSGQESGGKVSWKPFTLYNGEGKIRPLQRDCGIYRTSEDRQARTLSVMIDCQNESHSLKTGFIRDQSAIRVVRDTKIFRYLKDDLYGYRDCSGNEYHFFNGKSYELVNPGKAIAIYRTYVWVGKRRLTKYFYTSANTGIVKPLSLSNLEADFKEDTNFLTKLRQLAKNDLELIRFRHAIHLIERSTTFGI